MIMQYLSLEKSGIFRIDQLGFLRAGCFPPDLVGENQAWIQPWISGPTQRTQWWKQSCCCAGWANCPGCRCWVKPSMGLFAVADVQWFRVHLMAALIENVVTTLYIYIYIYLGSHNYAKKCICLNNSVFLNDYVFWHMFTNKDVFFFQNLHSLSTQTRLACLAA